MKFSTGLSAVVVTGAAVVAPLAVSAPGQAATSTSAAVPCHATMSNSHPADYTKTYVRVTTSAHAAVTASAHFKSVTRTYHFTANSAGKASTWYDVSGATAGRKVPVDVYVHKAGHEGKCSTSFTPHR